jgi:hypothetical protein
MIGASKVVTVEVAPNKVTTKSVNLVTGREGLCGHQPLGIGAAVASSAAADGQDGLEAVVLDLAAQSTPSARSSSRWRARPGTALARAAGERSAPLEAQLPDGREPADSRPAECSMFSGPTWGWGPKKSSVCDHTLPAS